jgi:hypothetical protein
LAQFSERPPTHQPDFFQPMLARVNTGQRVKLTVDTDDKPLLTIAGNLPTFGELFDDEADFWDED